MLAAMACGAKQPTMTMPLKRRRCLPGCFISERFSENPLTYIRLEHGETVMNAAST